MRSTVLAVAFSTMSFMFVLGCGSDAPTGNGTATVATVAVTPTAITLVSLGETVQLTASAKDASGNGISGKTFTWSSTDEGVATVSTGGLVTAVANGAATITATSGSATGTGSVTVQQVAASITLSSSSLVLAGPEDTATVSASVMDAGGSEIANLDLTWSSGDESIATVSSSGLVTAVASGSATIAVTSGSPTVTQALSITVEEGSLVDSAGGAVSLADDAVNLVFPAGAVGEAVFITAEPATGLPVQPVPIPNTAFDFGPDGIVFDEPVTLTIGYDPADVPLGVPEEELRLHKLIDGGYVQAEAGVVDVANHSVVGTIDRFSVFVVLRTLRVTTTSPMPNGTVSIAYSQTLAATGGDGNYTWAITIGSLPTGLTLNTSTGEISGTPTVVETQNFTVQVTSGDGQTDAQALSITVNDECVVAPGSEPFQSLVGTWTLTSFTLDGVEVDFGETNFEFTFMSDGTFTESVTGDTGGSFCDTGPNCTDDGRYIQTDVNLLICDPGCDEILDYAISGDTLSFSLTDLADEEETPFTATFVRTSASGPLVCGPVESLVGTWTLTSLTVDGVVVDFGGTNFEFTFMNDGTVLESVTGDTGGLFCDTGTSCTEGPDRYIQTDVNLLICDPGCDEINDYTISGNTWNFSFVGNEEDPPFTATFVRTG